MRSLLRLLALLLSVSLVAAACGDDDPVEEADDAVESTDAAEPSDDEIVAAYIGLNGPEPHDSDADESSDEESDNDDGGEDDAEGDAMQNE